MFSNLRKTCVCAALLLAAGWLAAGEEFAPYTETLAGTDYKFNMVPIKGGKFKLGSPDTEKGRKTDEGPQVEVTIRPFWMCMTETTWDLYDVYRLKLDQEKADMKKDAEKAADAVTRPTPPYVDMTFGMGHDNQPALCLTHHSAMEYCRWLSAKTGKTYRLPTEPEWEYACRAGTTTAYFSGDDPKTLNDYAWHEGNNNGCPQQIGLKKPNPWGLYDMHGNVAEWCLDHYEATRYADLLKSGKLEAPVILPTKKKYPHVARGGGWSDKLDALRSAARVGSDLDWSRQDPQLPQSIWWHTDARWVGFRVVRAVEEQPELKNLKSQVVKGED